MINGLEKKEIKEQFFIKHVAKRWQDEVFNIDERYSSDTNEIDNSIIFKFNSVCKNALLLQRDSLKGNIKYIYISFLRTSIMDNKAFYRIDLYDENWFLDKEECSTEIDLNFIFKSLFDHMCELENIKNEYGRTITSMDIDNIKFLEAGKYHVLAIEFLRSIVLRLIECSYYKEMNKDKDICIMVGEYMDRSEILYKEEDI